MTLDKTPQQLVEEAGHRVIVPVDGPLRIKQVPAARQNYLHKTATRVVRFIVLHSTEGHEGNKQDDNVAAMFQRLDLKPRRSCHYVVDSDSVTQCVPDHSIAWHCAKSGNLRGVGVELCGKARQTREEWIDTLSLPMLCIAARLVGDLCRTHKLPVQFVNAAALRQGGAGITTHAEVAAAWKETTHYDPGPHFPVDLFLKGVALAVGPRK
jgi:N-acetyl-anhydromuramyl-L-alanine amidase AmpD